MSKLSNINNTYGGSFNLISTNISGDKLLSINGLPQNSFIFTSPIIDNEDIGIPSIFATDYEGTPVRLTYTIQEGNGLYSENDILSLHIDNESLITKDNKLQIGFENIIDNDTVKVKNNKLKINTKTLDTVTSTKSGVFRIDNNTIKITNGKLYVETENLDIASHNNPGTVKLDGHTIQLDEKNRIYVNTKNLKRSNSKEYGISKPDNNTIKSNNGIYSVNIENLAVSSSKSFGISKADGKTIMSQNGIYAVNTANLTAASSAEYGIVKPDNSSFIINENNLLSVSDYRNIYENNISTYNILETVKREVSITYNLLMNYSIESDGPTISKFKTDTVTSTILSTPIPGSTPERIPTEKVSIDFIINTNCPFYVSVEFENNIMPGVILYYIDYNRIEKNAGTNGLNKIYDSTNGEDRTLSFSFIARNYASADWHEFSNYTRAKISVNYINNINIGRTVYFDIIRFNSMYNIKDAQNIINNYKRLLSTSLGIPCELNVYKLNNSEVSGKPEMSVQIYANESQSGSDKTEGYDKLPNGELLISKEKLIEKIENSNSNGDLGNKYNHRKLGSISIKLKYASTDQYVTDKYNHYGTISDTSNFYLKKSNSNKYIIYYIGDYNQKNNL